MTSKLSTHIAALSPSKFDPITFDPKLDDLPKVVVPWEVYKKLVGGKAPMGFNIKIDAGLNVLKKVAQSWLTKSRMESQIKKWMAAGEKSLVVTPEPKHKPGFEGGVSWGDQFTVLHEHGHTVWFKLPDEYRAELTKTYNSMPWSSVFKAVYKKRGYKPHLQPGEFFADTFAAWKFPKNLWQKWLAASKDSMIHAIQDATTKAHKPLHVWFREQAAGVETSKPTLKTKPQPSDDPVKEWISRIEKVIKSGLKQNKSPRVIAMYIIKHVNMTRKDPHWEP